MTRTRRRSISAWIAALLGLMLVITLVPAAEAKPDRKPRPKPSPTVSAPAPAPALTCPNPNPDLDYLCAKGPTYNIPALTDLNGWNDDHPEHFANIRYGDLNGDGADEMVARGATGIQVYRFDAALGQWSQIKIDPILSDADGWNKQAYWSTLQVGDVTGDGKAEVVIRGPKGIIAYRYVPGATRDVASWEQLAGNPPLSDPTKDNDPDNYLTMKLVPLGSPEGSTKKNVLYRLKTGVVLFRWVEGVWEQSSLNASFNDEAGYTNAAYYSTIHEYDTKTLIARSPHGVVTYTFDGTESRADGWGAWYFGTEPGQAGPFNGNPYDNSEFYSTVKPIRGLSAAASVAGRVPGGLVIQTLQPDNTWQTSPTLNIGADSMWSQAQHWGTFRVADVDGDGREDVLARSSTGLQVWSFDPDTNAWSTWSSGVPALTDDLWSNPSRFSTIDTPRLDPASTAHALVARGTHGVRTWRLDPASKTFARYRPYGNFPTLDQPALVAAQQLLELAIPVRNTYMSANIDNTALQLKQYMDDLVARCNGQPISENPNRYETCTPPNGSGVSVDSWTTTSNQLISELYWASQAVTHFDHLSDLKNALFVDENSEFPSIVDDLKLGQAQSIRAPAPSKPGPDLLGLFEGVADLAAPVMALIPGGEGGSILLELTAAALAITASTTPESDPDDHSVNDEFTPTYNEVQKTIATNQQHMQDAINNHKHHVLADYGLLSTVGHQVSAQVWILDQDGLLSVSRYAFTRWVYNKFLPALWDRWQVSKCMDLTTVAVRDRDRVDWFNWGCASAQPGERPPIYVGEIQNKWVNETLFESWYPTLPGEPPNELEIDFTSWDGYHSRGRPCTGPDNALFSLKPDSWGAYGYSCDFRNNYLTGPYFMTTYILRTPVSKECSYDGVGTGRWEYGDCTLGIGLDELNSWGFATRTCDYWRNTYQNGSHDGEECFNAQPASGVTVASAILRGSNSGQVSASFTDTIPKGFDLRRAKVELFKVLHEEGGSGGLVNTSKGEDVFPQTVRLKKASKKKAEFTIRGKPSIKGTLKVRGDQLAVQLKITGSKFDEAQRCATQSSTHLNTHILVTDKRGRYVQIYGSAPWTCVKDKKDRLVRLEYGTTASTKRTR